MEGEGTMLTFELKTGEIVHVELKDLPEFLKNNKGNLVTHHIKLCNELDFDGVVPDSVRVQ